MASTTQSPTIHSSASNKQQSDIHRTSTHQLNINSTGNHPKDTKYTSTLPTNHDLALYYQNDDRSPIQPQNGKQGSLYQSNVGQSVGYYPDASQTRTPHRIIEQPPTYRRENYQPLEHHQHVSPLDTHQPDLNPLSKFGMGDPQTGGYGSDLNRTKKNQLQSTRSLRGQSSTYSTIPHPTEPKVDIGNINGYPYGANQTGSRFPVNDHNLTGGNTQIGDLQIESQNTQRYTGHINYTNHAVPTGTMNRPLASNQRHLPTWYSPNQTFSGSYNKFDNYRKNW